MPSQAPFQGAELNAEARKVPEGLFQTDEGGDRFHGSWRRRRGIRHTSVAKYDNPVVFMLGFHLDGGDRALLVVEGPNAQGETNVTPQAFPPAGVGGFGVDGFGEGGFGE